MTAPEWPVLPRQRSAEDMAAWSADDVDDSEDDDSPAPESGAASVVLN